MARERKVTTAQVYAAFDTLEEFFVQGPTAQEREQRYTMLRFQLNATLKDAIIRVGDRNDDPNWRDIDSKKWGRRINHAIDAIVEEIGKVNFAWRFTMLQEIFAVITVRIGRQKK